MGAYILRRLLLMIPTIFGVTIVSFLVMQLAPGDPLLSGGAGGQQSDRETSREAYLLQKRALGLDRPALLNFNGFRDYQEPIGAAAYFLGRPVTTIEDELPELSIDADGDLQRRRAFLDSLGIPNLQTRLADDTQYAALALTIVDFVQVWCENAGRSAVPAGVALAREESADLDLRRGAIRALNDIVRDPFVYGYSREPKEDETTSVMQSWHLWWLRSGADWIMRFGSPDPQRSKELTAIFTKLCSLRSRNHLMEELEQFHKSDIPFFVYKLLGESTLTEKNLSALVLILYVGKPLRTNVPTDADLDMVNMVAENWAKHLEINRTRYEPSLGRRIWNVVTDTQYAHLLWRLLTFNFGPSALKTREPVAQRIWSAFTVTAPLMLGSEMLIYLIAIPLGIFCAVHRGEWLDRIISMVLFVLYSVPTFVAAMIVLLLFCYGDYFRWFPMSGLHSQFAGELSWTAWLVDYAWHAFLPITCLSLFSLAGMAMYARSSMLDVISADYIRTARAKGVPERQVIWKHALRNAMIPVITLFADFLPAMLGGSVLVEVLFSIPGMGRLSWAAIEQKDYPTLMALVYIDAIVVLLSLLLSDILYYVVDPRISLDAASEDPA